MFFNIVKIEGIVSKYSMCFWVKFVHNYIPFLVKLV